MHWNTAANIIPYRMLFSSSRWLFTGMNNQHRTLRQVICPENCNQVISQTAWTERVLPTSRTAKPTPRDSLPRVWVWKESKVQGHIWGSRWSEMDEWSTYPTATKTRWAHCAVNIATRISAAAKRLLNLVHLSKYFQVSKNGRDEKLHGFVRLFWGYFQDVLRQFELLKEETEVTDFIKFSNLSYFQK